MDDIDKESWPIFNPKDFVLDILQKKYNKQSQVIEKVKKRGSPKRSIPSFLTNIPKTGCILSQ